MLIGGTIEDFWVNGFNIDGSESSFCVKDSFRGFIFDSSEKWFLYREVKEFPVDPVTVDISYWILGVNS
jgi:hypothetical protein